MGMIDNLMGALIPEKLVAICKKEKGSVGEGFKYLVLAGVISILCTMISLTVAGAGGVFEVGYFLFAIVSLVLTLVLTYVTVWLAAWLISALLKGKAEFGQLFFGLAVPSSAINILSALISLVLGFIPGFGAVIAGIIVLVLGLYALYLAYLVFKTIYSFEMVNAIIALVVYLVVGAVISMIVMGIVLVAILGLLGVGALGGAGAMGWTPVF